MGEQFEGKLVTSLGYRGPWDLYDMLKETLKSIDRNRNRNSTSSNSNLIDTVHSPINDDVNFCEREHIDSNASINIIKCSKDDDHDHKSDATLHSTHSSKRIWRVLDLGCGSGLVGKVFQDLVIPVGERNGEKYCKREVETVQFDEKNKIEGDGDNEKMNKKSMREEVINKEIINEEFSESTSDEIDRNNLKLLKMIFYECHGPLMIGIDVSMKMVDISRRTNYYTSVIRFDLTAALKLFEIDSNIDFHDNCTKDYSSVINMDQLEIENKDFHINDFDDAISSEINNGNLKNNIDTKESSISIHENINMNHDSSKIVSKFPVKVTPLNLIIAADTFIYVGALGFVFRQVKRCLEIHGFFLFSIEDLDLSPMRVNEKNDHQLFKSEILPDDILPADSDNIIHHNVGHHSRKTAEIKMEIELGQEKGEKIKPETDYCLLQDRIKNLKIINFEPVGAVPGWGGELLKSARFAHSNLYIEILAHIYGFQIVKSKSVILRTEETIPLHGRLYVLESI